MNQPGGPRSLHILIVEDHAESAAALCALLGAWGHRVAAAPDVHSAWELVEEAYLDRDDFDVVIADIGLPDGNGCDLMRELSALFRVKGIAVSGRASEGDIARSLASGFEWHLAKPLRPESLAHSLVARNAA